MNDMSPGDYESDDRTANLNVSWHEATGHEPVWNGVPFCARDGQSWPCDARKAVVGQGGDQP